MAKKNFKKGLGSLIRDTRKNPEETEQKKEENIESENQQSDLESDECKQKIENLKTRLSYFENELWLWRTGKLNLENFNDSLSEKKLFYNALLNSFEKLDSKED